METFSLGNLFKSINVPIRLLAFALLHQDATQAIIST